MKKIIYSAAITCLLAAAVSCKSTKAGAKTSEAEGEAPSVEEVSVEGQSLSEEEVSELDAAALEETAVSSDKKADSKNKDTEDSSSSIDSEARDFTALMKASRKNVKECFGKIQIKIKSGRGSFTLAALNEEDKPVSVLSTANEYVTNAFYLKTSKKIYNLVTDNTVRSAARTTNDGAMLMYEIPSVAQMTVNFSCFASEKNNDPDMIKVTATIRNTSNRNDEYSFKTVLDTVLGEATNYHFHTFEGVPVKNETLYRTLQNQKWFESKNMNAAMQFFFTGADCTVPELVALANYSTLEKKSWEPDMLSYRSFDTVLSYNNSAVCAIWKPFKLAPSETGKIVFYLALSGDGTPATGEKFVYSKELIDSEKENPDVLVNIPAGLEVITPEDNSLSDKQNEAAPVTELSASDSSLPSEVQTPSENQPADFYIKNITKEHLTPEYIQSLLDRIAALEEDSPLLNRQELLQLNAELDAILSYLRQ